MKTIEAYEAADGLLFSDEDKARAHDDDLLGQELDGLLRLFKLDLSRSTEYRALLSVMKDRAELEKACSAIMRILAHSKD